jgi:hypothetical protein
VELDDLSSYESGSEYEYEVLFPDEATVDEDMVKNSTKWTVASPGGEFPAPSDEMDGGISRWSFPLPTTIFWQ